MTAIWLPFLIGMITGSALVWVMSTTSSPSRTPSAEGWTVDAITSRIQREHNNGGREASGISTYSHTRHRRSHQSFS